MPGESAAPDHYAVLQVARDADTLVITKVHRLLAALYHPDNRETGNIERFRRVIEAGRVLTDPVRRAAYDRGQPGEVGEQPAEAPREAELSAPVIADQQSQRMILLQALYNIRRNRANRPDLPLSALAELIECTIDEMQFTLWYLRGKRLIEQTDDGWAITVAGVDFVEGNRLEPGGERDPLSLYPGTHSLEARYPSSPDETS